MPETQDIVINTGPLIALAAALGDLRVLQIYRQVWVPFEVSLEIAAAGSAGFARQEFEAAHWLHTQPQPLSIASHLLNVLDSGEAAVIQLALNRNIQTVVIDEAAGRRVARLNNLRVTGSIGILLRAKGGGYPLSVKESIRRMQARGVWLSERVVAFALTQAGE